MGLLPVSGGAAPASFNATTKSNPYRYRIRDRVRPDRRTNGYLWPLLTGVSEESSMLPRARGFSSHETWMLAIGNSTGQSVIPCLP